MNAARSPRRSEPALEIGKKRRDLSLALGLPDSGVAADELALDDEDRVDPPDRFCGDR